METNNKEFRIIKRVYLFILIVYILLCLSIYYNQQTYIWLSLILLLTMIFISYIYQYSMIKNIFTNIRKVINAIENKEDLYLEGDIGLLYDKVITLNNRVDNYSKMIKKEKEKLKDTIEDICHQMKTPLSIISINNELLLEEIDNDKIIRNQKQIDKMKYLMNYLLNIAKIENNAVKFHYQKLPLSYLIKLSILNINTLNINKEIINKVDNTEFYYDESWMQEAIVNILKNDLEQESINNITITNEVIGNYLKIYIEDDGEGIDEKTKQHLFDRFYKGKNRNKDSVGIGLALTKEIVKAHKGYIDVYNKEGACFELTFPIYLVNEKYENCH